MREHFLTTTRTARYFTLGVSETADELWFVCHGYAQLASRFLERFRPIEAEGRCVVAPEGLSRFYLTEDPAERRVGAAWMTREDRLHEIDDYVRYLDAVHRAVTPAQRRPTITALGFSQGAATVSRWAALGSTRVDRLILWGGEVPPDLDLTRLRGPELLLVYGTRDAYFTPKIVAATESRLRDHAIRYDLISFEGGHEIDAPTLLRVARPRV
jgi:predicted esterase